MPIVNWYFKAKSPRFTLDIGIWLISLHLGWVNFMWFKPCVEITFYYLAEYKPPKKRLTE